VRVNDRGPYIAGRVLDLSRGAARALGMVERGVVPVELDSVDEQ
jgi:rare lipoprotein A